MKKQSSISAIRNATLPLVARAMVLPHIYEAKEIKYPQTENLCFGSIEVHFYFCKRVFSGLYRDRVIP